MSRSSSYEAADIKKPALIDRANTDQLIVEHGAMIKYIAYRLAVRLPSHIEIDDLISSGVIGLLDAIEKYDPSRATKFKTYAEIRVRGAMLDELRAQDWAPRSARQKANLIATTYSKLEQKLCRHPYDDEVAVELGISIEQFYELLKLSAGQSILSFEDLALQNKDSSKQDLLETIGGSTANDPELMTWIDEIKTIIINGIEELSEKEQILLSLYYYEELTMKEIGVALSITESRVSQIHTQATLKLRGKLERFTADGNELDIS
ncbi:MAG: FliA/WhiG family RNA polymerase sigma factor [Nitrospinota bacterium]